MLLFNLQKKWAEVDSLTEHLYDMGMDAFNVYDGQNVADEIWKLDTAETTELFIRHRHIVIVVSDELFLSVSALYYIELVRKLYQKGKIKIYIINNTSVDKYPNRCKWFSECIGINDYSIHADEKTYAYAMDIVLGVAYDLFMDKDGNVKGITNT